MILYNRDKTKHIKVNINNIEITHNQISIYYDNMRDGSSLLNNNEWIKNDGIIHNDKLYHLVDSNGGLNPQGDYYNFTFESYNV